jgi:hypothetical protein
MGTEPEEIRAEIDATRAELAADVDRFADRTSPARIVQRRTDRMRRAMHSVREQVMGTPTHAAHRVGRQAGHAVGTVRDAAAGTVGTVRDTAVGTADTVRYGAQQTAQMAQKAPEQAMRSTQGNPMAAGMIAFGAGLLAATLIPRTEAEERAAGQLMEQAEGVIEPVKEAVRESAQNFGQEVKDVSGQAAQQVRETAAEAAQTTGQHARDQAQQATDRTRSTGY